MDVARKRSQKVEFAKQLRHYREDMGWTQLRLAEETGMDNADISDYEAARHLPGTDRLLQLSRALGVSVDDLLGTEPPRKTRKAE